jgi:hypothetical protein
MDDKARADLDTLETKIVDLLAKGDGIEAGFTTTEFWGYVVALVADLAAPAIGLTLSPQERLLAALALTASYGAFRTWRKAHGPAKLYADLLKHLAELRGEAVVHEAAPPPVDNARAA